MKLSFLLVCCLGCSSADNAPPIHDPDAGMDSGTDAHEEPAPPVSLSKYCCKQGGTVQTCTIDPNPWTCVPDSNQPYSYDCYTSVCEVGQSCIGESGPGKVELCP